MLRPMMAIAGRRSTLKGNASHVLHPLLLKNILRHIDPSLGNDLETNNETTAVARQQSGPQWTGWKGVFSTASAPLAAHATINTTVGTLFSVPSVPKYYKQDN
jgi:hypothetical protein